MPPGRASIAAKNKTAAAPFWRPRKAWRNLKKGLGNGKRLFPLPLSDKFCRRRFSPPADGLTGPAGSQVAPFSVAVDAAFPLL